MDEKPETAREARPVPRWLPGEPLPPYAFVAPHRPHPTKDPQGHSYGRDEAPEAPLDPARWRESKAFLRGFDLFNRGFYWEAHEAWEGLWHAAGREGPVALLLKGLIKLAAAGVKVRQRMPDGVRLHCERAEAHFRGVAAATGAPRVAGLDLDRLVERARETARRADHLRGDGRREVEVVFDWTIDPE